MKRMLRFPIFTALVASSAACFAAEPASQVSRPQAQTAPGAATAPAPQGLPEACLDVQSTDNLTNEFAARLREAIAASGVLSLASAADSCSLQLHVPGNLLRFQTAGGVMVSTAVIVTTSAGRYLSTSITACQASDLKPCAVRAVSAAKLALMVTMNDGT